MKIMVDIDATSPAFEGELCHPEVCLILHKIIMQFAQREQIESLLVFDSSGRRSAKVTVNGN